MVIIMQLEINNNLLRVDNYKQILDINNDLIILKNIKIKGINLKVIDLNQKSIIIKGIFLNLELGD